MEEKQQVKTQSKMSTKTKAAIAVAVAVGFGTIIYFAFPGVIGSCGFFC